MSSLTQTIWTCNGCGTKTALADRDQPAAWVRIYVVAPPLGSLTDLAENQGDYCNDCWIRTYRAMQTP